MHAQSFWSGWIGGHDTDIESYHWTQYSVSVSFFLGNVMYGVCVCVRACVCACTCVCTYNGVLVVIAPCPRSVCIYCLCFSSEIND